MRLVVAVSVLVCAALAAASAEASVDEAWMEVQEALSASDEASLTEPIEELVESAEEIDVRRLTPQASALVAWSHGRSSAGEEALQAAVRLDAELPAAHFVLAERSWEEGRRLQAVPRYLRGWVALFQNEMTRRNLLWSTALWAAIGLALAAAVTMVVLTARTLRRSAHDTMVVSRMIFERGNAVVFGLVLLLLPLLAGLGPVWLLVYLFVIGWVYLDRGQRIVAVACCLVLALLPVGLDALQRGLFDAPTVTRRVAVALDERQLEPSALREFLDLEEVFDGDSTYHLILGELLRMHSAPEPAKAEFQSAALEPLGDARSFVILGNMALEDGDAQLAIQYYDEAIATDGRAALAYHNLSSAYDLVRRFQQGDIARARARELAGGRSASLGLRGRDPRVRYPAVTSDDLRSLVRGLTPEQRQQAGLSPGSWRSLRQLLSPLSMVFWATGLFGAVVLAVRLRWFSGARECGKCGKVYRFNDEPGESGVYCKQCVSVFLQRDLVPIDQQAAKLAQVRRWGRWSSFARRLGALLAPGGYQVVVGRIVVGVVLALVFWFGLAGALVWAPRFLSAIEPTMALPPVTIALVLLSVAAWLGSVAASWRRR